MGRKCLLSTTLLLLGIHALPFLSLSFLFIAKTQAFLLFSSVGKLCPSLPCRHCTIPEPFLNQRRKGQLAGDPHPSSHWPMTHGIATGLQSTEKLVWKVHTLTPYWHQKCPLGDLSTGLMMGGGKISTWISRCLVPRKIK